MNQLHLYVHFANEKIHTKAVVAFSKPFQGELTFSLAETLVVESVRGEDTPLTFSEGDAYSPLFQASSRPITVCIPVAVSKMEICYSGTVHGAVNLLRPELRAVSFYSAWYPFNCPEIPADALIEVSAGTDDLLLKGRPIPEQGIWIYGEDKQFDPFNLILIDRAKCFFLEGNGVHVCTPSPQEQDIAAELIASYQDILHYYQTELYSAAAIGACTDVPNMDIVSLGTPGLGGGYFRCGLIVTDCLPANPNLMIVLIAHELGHTWGNGAGFNWEDWLNETVAEWSCLCYLLERKGKEAFLEELRRNSSGCANMPVIRPEDGSRPSEGVHEMGTALFYHLSLLHGFETIKQILRIFASLPPQKKNTENFLNAVEQAFDRTFADSIRYSLTHTDYLSALDSI